MWWLLSADVRASFEKAFAAGVIPSAAAQMEYVAANGFDGASAPRILQVAGDSATITVSGVMTKGASLFAMLFGGGNVTYPEIIAAIDAAERNPAVKNIDMIIDSPGGQFDGLFEVVAAMQSAKKKIKAYARNNVASAAYLIASQADEIVAVNRAARIGSVGVVVDAVVSPDVVSVTSTEAPNKRPDLSTEEGRAVLREELDALHSLFVEAIAEGRNTTVDKINAEFGRGGTLLADEALKRGMIDGIQGQPLRVVKSAAKPPTARASGGNEPETGPMNLAELKVQHPDVYAAAVQEGVNTERDRVSAHLTMGEASGAMDVALAAVKDGTGMTATLNATYMAAGMNRRDQQNRQADSNAAAAAAAGADQQANAGDQGAKEVLAIVKAGLGLVGA